MATYSTYAAAAAAYLANADYAQVRSVTKALALIGAAEAMILLGPTSTGSAESTVSFDANRFEKAADRARDFVRRHSDNTIDQGGVRVTRASFQFGRG